ncbi:MAG TPA: efflux transporter outer membrane subunit [Acetobacteraceae bacterium]|nr:efflux transporter outer membrane subunit [Acetobacteraceae bacterium]
MMGRLDIFRLPGVPALSLRPLALFLPRMPEGTAPARRGRTECKWGTMLRVVFAAGAVLASSVVLGGCTVGPNFRAPSWASPASWFAGPREKVSAEPSIPVAAPVDPDWWNLFHDAELTALERRVAAENLDVRVATTRLAESRAQLGVARASEFPAFNANTSYTRQKASNFGQFASAPNPLGANGRSGNTAGGLRSANLAPFSVYQAGFDASWELDLWGGVKRSVESATASVRAAAEARRAVLLSSLAEVARDYIALRGVQTQLRIAHDNVHTARQSLQLTQQRAAGGVTTDLDVANASAQLRTTMAQIPDLEQQEAADINALSLLLGQPPNALRGELAEARPVPPVPPRVPIGLPSQLARRRPDVMQAEAQLHAATANIGVAVAAFYPSVTLSGSIGLQALQPANFFRLGAREYAAGPGITIPIFEGGQLKATLRLRKAQQEEAAVFYQKTVLQAFHDVDNALTAYQTEQARRDQLVLAVAQSRRALGLAQSRYQQGVADFLTVLDAERSLLSSQLQLADSTTTVSENLVALYKALGGGWQTDLPREVATSAGR